MGTFYKNKNSKMFLANGGYCPLCKDCVSQLFDGYTRQFKSTRTACILLSYMLDIPFYNSIYNSVSVNNPDFTMGIIMRQIGNNKQYGNLSFANTLLTGELNKTDGQIQDEAEDKWTTQESRNKNEVMKILGYDPFIGYSSKDRRMLFGDLIKYLDDDVVEDSFKLSQILQIVNNNSQVNHIDLAISGMDPAVEMDQIGKLNGIKWKLVSSNDKIAKENEISVKNRSNKEVGKGTLTYLMRDLREKDFTAAETNFYDQLRSEGTQWAADMSFKAIKENTFFDENDEKEIYEVQHKLIEELQKENDDLREKSRLLLIENSELKQGDAGA